MRTHRAAVQPCTVLRHTAEASYQWPAPCRQRMLVVRFATQSYGKLAQAQAIVRNSFAASPRPLVVLPLHGSGGARRLTEQVSSSSIREPPDANIPRDSSSGSLGCKTSRESIETSSSRKSSYQYCHSSSERLRMVLPVAALE